MKLTITPIIFAFTLAYANPQYEKSEGDTQFGWKPPGLNDVRGPCPMLNTLANHGFIPHDGRNITEHHGVSALTTALNINETFAVQIWRAGLPANPQPNATFFTLEHLGRHNVLEHDASLSRSDAFFGSNIAFNQTIFNQTRRYWTSPTLTTTMLANAKLARQIESRAFNPNYTFTSLAESFSLGEISSFVAVFGNLQTKTANKTLLEYFFENERLPSELGWAKPDKAIQNEDVRAVSDLLLKALDYVTDSELTLAARRGDIHSGYIH